MSQYKDQYKDQSIHQNEQSNSFVEQSVHQSSKTASDLGIKLEDLLILKQQGGGQVYLIVPSVFHSSIVDFLMAAKVAGINRVERLTDQQHFAEINAKSISVLVSTPLLGLEVPIFSVDGPKDFDPFIRLSQREQRVREREKSISGLSHLSLDRAAFGKVCIIYCTKENKLHLYGDMQSEFTKLMDHSPLGGKPNPEIVFYSMNVGNDELSERGNHHKTIQLPTTLLDLDSRDRLIVGGANAYFDIDNQTLYFAGQSPSFGRLSSQAILSCLTKKVEGITVVFSPNIATTPEEVVFVGNARLKLIELLELNR
jgi:hypothetical protein